MRRSRLDAPDIKAHIFKQLLLGDSSQYAIAKALNIYPSTLSRFLHRPDIKSQFEIFEAKIIDACLASAAENVLQVIRGYRTTTDFQAKEHGFRASMKVLELSGLLMSSSPNTFLSEGTNSERISVNRPPAGTEE